ncbi:MAG: sigma 54-interacting transcriptional regulator [Desulfuromonadales bacterium]
MQTVLKEIQDTAIKYADIVSQVIDVDVDIVDCNFYRIAGTGRYRERINENMAAEGFIYKATMESGETQIIDDPGKNPICGPCPKNQVCAEKMQICKPIKMGQETIGVIGLVCFSDEQRDHLLQRFDSYLAFLDQIVDFIVIKVYEKREHRRTELMIHLMEQVVSKMDVGVIFIDRHDTISNLNENAAKQLGLKELENERAIRVTPTGDNIGEADEFKVVIAQQEYSLFGNMLEVDFDLEDYAKILVFHEIKTVKSRIYELTQIGENVHIGDILGHSTVIQELKEKVRKISPSTSTILIRGESGTGKELVARAIHRESERRDEPFVAVNCGSIPDALMESELFGYVKGAFTGADPKGRIGKFELANKGTLFLDEIGDMPLYLQVKLLRVLQERSFTRIGSNPQISVDVRVIAATHMNLAEMIKDNTFREDLFYRLNVIPLEIAPLRERKADIEPLAYHFIRKYSHLFGKSFKRLEPDVVEVLLSHDWPGNVRELENVIEFMVNMMDADGLLSRKHLPRSLTLKPAATVSGLDPHRVRSIKELEFEEIRKALQIYGASSQGKKVAAQKLGIGIATLYRKIDAGNLSN